ncbi:hypothetical protein [Sulfurovum sp.]|uniref:hypothetical protein n=1 Tax=Sulfurovum sp. TaxID=1969726 RepID=UPI003561604A
MKQGRGRPKGSTIPPDQKKRNFTTKLAPEWFVFLDNMKAKGHSKAYCIEKGLELLMDHLSG